MCVYVPPNFISSFPLFAFAKNNFNGYIVLILFDSFFSFYQNLYRAVVGCWTATS